MTGMMGMMIMILIAVTMNKNESWKNATCKLVPVSPRKVLHDSDQAVLTR